MVVRVFLARDIDVLLTPPAQLHPIVKGVFTLVDAVFQVIKAQADLDKNVKALIAEMADVCQLAKEYAPLEGVSNSTDPIVEEILEGVVRSANIIGLYCKKRSSSRSPQRPHAHAWPTGRY